MGAGSLVGPRPINSWGRNCFIWADVRRDDECGNCHNTFATLAGQFARDNPHFDSARFLEACGVKQ